MDEIECAFCEGVYDIEDFTECGSCDAEGCFSCIEKALCCGGE